MWLQTGVTTKLCRLFTMCLFVCIFLASNIQNHNFNLYPLAVTTVLLLINYQHFPQIINEIGAQKSIHSPMSCKQILMCCLFYSTKRGLCTQNWVAPSHGFKLLVKKGLFCLKLCTMQWRPEHQRVGPIGRTAWAWSENTETFPSANMPTWRPSLIFLNKQQHRSLLPAPG